MRGAPFNSNPNRKRKRASDGKYPQARMDNANGRTQRGLGRRLRRPHGKRRLKTFSTKKDAEAWKVNALHEIQVGIHTAASASITVAEAAEHWLTHVENEGRERATLAQY